MRKTLGTKLKLIKKNANRLFLNDLKEKRAVSTYWKYHAFQNKYVEKEAASLGLFFNEPEYGSLVIFLKEFKSYNIKWKTLAKMGRIAKKKRMLLDINSVKITPDGRQWKLLNANPKIKNPLQ